MQKSNARFLISARLHGPTADLLTFTFQLDICGTDLRILQIPHQLREKPGLGAFA